MKKPFTDRQYITRSGLHCPACGKHGGVVGEAPEIEDDPVTVARPVKCTHPKCGATWLEVFKMVGYTNLKDRNGTSINREAQTPNA